MYCVNSHRVLTQTSTRHYPAVLCIVYFFKSRFSASSQNHYIHYFFLSAGAWSFSVSELAAPGVEVGRLTATDPDLEENALLEFAILDTEEAEIFNITGRDQEAVIALNKVSDKTQVQTQSDCV